MNLHFLWPSPGFSCHGRSSIDPISAMARWAAAAGSRGTSPPRRGLNVPAPSPGNRRNRCHPGQMGYRWVQAVNFQR